MKEDKKCNFLNIFDNHFHVFFLYMLDISSNRFTFISFCWILLDGRNAPATKRFSAIKKLKTLTAFSLKNK